MAHKILDKEEFCKQKGCIIRVLNKDDTCFVKAIIKGLYRKGGPLLHPHQSSIQNENPILDVLTRRWYNRAQVPLGCVASVDFPKFQSVLSEYKIRLVIYSMRYANSIIYDGKSTCKAAADWEPLFLYHYEEHFAVITSMSGFIHSSYFCKRCLVGYDHKEHHACEGFCMQCKTFDCDGKALDVKEDKSLWIKCDDCLRSFRTQMCFNKHETKTCKNFFICSKCESFVDKSRLPKGRKQHRCTDYYCVTCASWVDVTHKCYMEKESLPDGGSDPDEIIPEIYIYYDFECEQDTGVHIPNLLVARWTCTNCLDLPEDTEKRQEKIDGCRLCKVPENKRELSFKGIDTAKSFCD